MYTWSQLNSVIFLPFNQHVIQYLLRRTREDCEDSKMEKSFQEIFIVASEVSEFTSKECE